MTFDELTWLFTCDNRNRGIVRLNFNEAALLWRSARQTRGAILEIGRRHGGSTVLLLAASEARSVVSIDIAPEHHPECDQVFANPRNSSRLQLLTQSSHLPILGVFGFAFIDGDHTYDGVKADVVAHWASLHGTEGAPALVAFHDAVPNPGLAWAQQINHCPGVATLCAQLVAGGYAEPECSAGSMQVVRKIRELDPTFAMRTASDIP